VVLKSTKRLTTISIAACAVPIASMRHSADCLSGSVDRVRAMRKAISLDAEFTRSGAGALAGLSWAGELSSALLAIAANVPVSARAGSIPSTDAQARALNLLAGWRRPRLQFAE